MQTHHSDITGVASGLFVLLGVASHYLALAEPVLSAISYLIAIVAGVLTIYYKLKNKK